MSIYKTVTTSCGVLKGKIVSSKLNFHYYSFQGIPYAKPPIGCLRFKPPQPLDPWEGIKDALQEGNRAPHFDMVTKLYTGDEDCLYLNIYFRKTDSNWSNQTKRPVMVYIHGGGYAYGHGDSDVYGPEFLIQHDIILVTFNYRLGVLGFLNLECPDAPGNLGLKDQVAAFKWVQKEIYNFGGDADNVTIFGESAGGSCVHLHMLSDLSRGTFHKAIVQSGTALCNWAFTNCHLKRAYNLAHILGFNVENTRDLLECLRKVPAKTFAEVQDRAICSKNNGTVPGDCPQCNEDLLEIEGVDQAFVPSIENNIIEDAFLHKHPLELTITGKMLDVPLIIGVTAHEGICILNSIIKHPTFLRKFALKVDNMVPDGISKTKDTTEINSKMRNFYFKNDQPTLESDMEGIINFYTDYNFLLPTVRVVRHFKDHCSSPVFCYQFDYDGGFAWYKRLMVKHRNMNFIPKGVCHADDLGYMFTNTILGLQDYTSVADMAVVNNITLLWTNFAKTGNPTPSGTPVDWAPTSKEHITALKINEKLKPTEILEKDRLAFWNLYLE